MNEACDIVDHPARNGDEAYRACRTCGATWDPDEGEISPCDDRVRSDIWPAVIAATLACLCVAALLAATALAHPFVWAEAVGLAGRLSGG
jgi:hypothetical protein